MEKRTGKHPDERAHTRHPEQARHSPPSNPENPDEAARRSGQVGADRPEYKNKGPQVHREADKKPNPEGPQFEEGGQYPGVKHRPKGPRP